MINLMILSNPLPELLARGVAIIQKTVTTLQPKPGVYQFIDAKDQILYIGKAIRLNKRVLSYSHVTRLPIRLQRMIAEANHIKVVETQTEIEALLLESNLIKRWRPPYNILLKDDKSFPYISLSQDHPFPRLGKHRGSKEEKNIYFGPFASNVAVNEVIIILYKVFQLRSCTDSFFSLRKRPCLQYYIKRCTGPCVGKVTQEAYHEQVKNVIAFLRGRAHDVQKIIAKKMQHASDKMAYEEAALWRDRLNLLTKIQSHQRINIPDIVDADILAIAKESGKVCIQAFFFRNGCNYGTESFFLDHHQEATLEENLAAFIMQFYQEHTPPHLLLLSHKPPQQELITKALKIRHKQQLNLGIPRRGKKKDLIDHALSNAYAAIQRKTQEQNNNFEKGMTLIKEAFNLSVLPERVEVYDNSHLQGSNPYGVMIVATPQGFDRKSYRKFSFSQSTNFKPGDDFAMMREVIQRRFSRVESEAWPLPNLLLIDGGKGQLKAVAQILAQMDVEGIDIIAIAKGHKRTLGQEKFFRVGEKEKEFPTDSPTLHFLQRLRDEAHRFAVGAHRTGRKKQLISSLLDDIPGIGAKRKKALLQHFGSAKAVGQAATADLEIVPGINKGIAKKIHAYFHERN